MYNGNYVHTGNTTEVITLFEQVFLKIPERVSYSVSCPVPS